MSYYLEAFIDVNACQWHQECEPHHSYYDPICQKFDKPDNRNQQDDEVCDEANKYVDAHNVKRNSLLNDMIMWRFSLNWRASFGVRYGRPDIPIDMVGLR